MIPGCKTCMYFKASIQLLFSIFTLECNHNQHSFPNDWYKRQLLPLGKYLLYTWKAASHSTALYSFINSELSLSDEETQRC